MKFPTTFYRPLVAFRKRVRLVVAALAGHGVFDLKHFRLLTNPNVPIWLAILMIGFDLLAKAFGIGLGTKSPAKAGAFGLLEVQGS